MLKVSRMPSGEPEIFRSLQGEGISAGAPSVFVRLATCNLSCVWCDTKYTWDWRHHDIQRETMDLPVEDVQHRILTLGASRVVITGGEPLLQQDKVGLLATILKAKNIPCEVETNGTISPTTEAMAAIAQWNVSPKLENSGNPVNHREVPDALTTFASLSNAYAKFVIVQPSDADEACALAERYGFPRKRIIFMPEGTRPDILRLRGEWLANLCIDLGIHFSSRLHILTWGDQRGR